jgi:hypothetical protein
VLRVILQGQDQAFLITGSRNQINSAWTVLLGLGLVKLDGVLDFLHTLLCFLCAISTQVRFSIWLDFASTAGAVTGI